MKTHKYLSIFVLMMITTALLSCEDVEDPFVDRVEAPVLLVFDDVTGYLAGGGLTYVPSVTKSVTAANYTNPVTLSLTIYELDKSGILNNAVGIDSVPVTDLTITFSKRDGALATPLISDDEGKIVMTTTWEALGISDVETIVNAQPAKSVTIPLLWVGTYKGVAFARYSQVVFSKPAS